jgi:single-stranded-DNA-specific exonuclease
MSAAAPGTFVHMGGHELAGGFAVEYTQIHDLESGILEAYEKVRHTPLEKKEDAKVDSDMTFDAVNLATYGEIAALAPYGIGNQKPLFKWSSQVVSVKLFGKTKNHLELGFENKSGKVIKCIGFFMTDIIKKQNNEAVKIETGMYVEIEGNIELSTFAGRREIRVRIQNVV